MGATQSRNAPSRSLRKKLASRRKERTAVSSQESPNSNTSETPISMSSLRNSTASSTSTTSPSDFEADDLFFTTRPVRVRATRTTSPRPPPTELRVADEKSEDLIDLYHLARMQIQAFEALNVQSREELQSLYTPFAVPTHEEDAKHELMLHLLDELTTRNTEIRERRILLAVVDLELRRRGESAQRPPLQTCFVDAPEDHTLCLYCCANPRDTVYRCCGHTGACSPCVKVMRSIRGNCPHCRAANPNIVSL